MDDVRNLLKWKNDRTMRRFSVIGRDMVTMAQHQKWLRQNLRYIEIILEDEIPVGDVRVRDGFIHIKLDPEYRGRGIGTEVISRFKYKGLKTLVHHQNIASLRLFISSGFRLEEYGEKNGVGYYILKCL